MSAQVRESRTASGIERVMADEPDLSTYGYKFASRDAWNDGVKFESYRALMGTPDFERQVETALAYINAKGIGKLGSYGLKHKVERWAAERGAPQYISNGAAICAAIIAGYSPRREPNSPNCGFTLNRAGGCS